MTTTADPATCRKLGGCMSTTPHDPCIYCGNWPPPPPTPPLKHMSTVPANCAAIRHTPDCTCTSARARLRLLISTLRPADRPWWRG